MSRDAKEKPDRVLREREVVDLFMACGIYEHTAKDIVKTIPELTGATEKQGDTFKVLLREAISIIDKEGIPEIIAETHQDAHEHLEQDTPKRKVFLCKFVKMQQPSTCRFQTICVDFFVEHKDFEIN